MSENLTNAINEELDKINKQLEDNKRQIKAIKNRKKQLEKMFVKLGDKENV